MNISIAIKSCHKHSARRAAVTDTWRKQIDWADAFFLVGNPSEEQVFGALMCNVSDAFENIAPKIGCACAYALSQNSDLLFVCDDDTYVRPDRLEKAAHDLIWGTSLDYVGYMRTGLLEYNQGVPYAQGSAYWLSARAMAIIVDSPAIRPGVIDDGAVGQALIDKVPFTHDWRYEPGPHLPRVPAPDNNIITTHKALPNVMQSLHEKWVRQ